MEWLGLGWGRFGLIFLPSSKKLIKNIYFSIEESQRMQKAAETSCIKPGCAFCLSPSDQTRLLLRAALLSMRKMLTQKKYSHPTPTEPSPQSPSNIHRLIRVLFEKQQFEIMYSKHCTHPRLLNLFREKLKCRPQDLQRVIEGLCDKLARRHYELQIIALQVKNVENSVIQLQDSAELNSKPRKETCTTPTSPSRQVKLEQAEPLKHEASPTTTTNANYNITFEDLPLGYNILFYSAPFYQ